MSKRRCSYCGKLIIDDKTCCSGECEKKYDRFEKHVNKDLKLFIGIIVGSLIATFVGMSMVVLSPNMGIIIMVLGIVIAFGTFMVFPFATPESIILLGVRRSVLILRIVVIGFLGWIFFIIVSSKIG